MNTKYMEPLVGLFFILGLGALFILTFRVASLDAMPSGGTYAVEAKFDNIGGLKPGAAVTMGGVRIGRVRSIDSLRDTFEAQVTIDIEKRYDNIPDDSDAKILTAGLLGEQYIGVVPGGSEKSLIDGASFHMTQSALILENLVGQFLTSAVAKPDAKADCK